MSRLTVGSKLPGVVTHVEFVDSRCVGHVQLCDNDTVETLADKIQFAILTAQVIPCNTGDFILALFDEDQVWYRAKVIQVYSDKLKVLFVDYGNVETISINNAKQMSHDLREFPILATKGELLDIYPNNGVSWTEPETETVENKLVTDGLEYIVEIKSFDTRGGNFRLYSEGTQVTHGKLAPPKQAIAKSSPAGLKLQIGQSYRSFLSYVESANKFWIQLVDKQNELDDLMANLAEYAPTGASLANPSSGSLCLANFSEDQAPYRSCILTINAGKSLVQFIDYGNSESKSVSELMNLPDAYKNVPIQAAKCCYKQTKINPSILEDKLQDLTAVEDGVVVTVLSKVDEVYNVEIDQIESIPVQSSGQSSAPVNRSYTPKQLDPSQVQSFDKRINFHQSGPNPGFTGSGPFTFWGNLRVMVMEGVDLAERREVPQARYKGQRACYFLPFLSKKSIYIYS